MTRIFILERPIWLHAMAAAAFIIAGSPNMPLLAQGLDSEQAIEAIVGSEVETNEERAASEEGRILAAIENTSANTSEVRKKFSLDNLEIIFLPDIGEEQTTVEAKIEEYEEQIVELREAIEGSAMFFHAVDSRSVMLRNIVAMEFDDENGVTIFVAGSEPAQ